MSECRPLPPPSPISLSVCEWALVTRHRRTVGYRSRVMPGLPRALTSKLSPLTMIDLLAVSNPTISPSKMQDLTVLPERGNKKPQFCVEGQRHQPGLRGKEREGRREGKKHMSVSKGCDHCVAHCTPVKQRADVLGVRKVRVLRVVCISKVDAVATEIVIRAAVLSSSPRRSTNTQACVCACVRVCV